MGTAPKHLAVLRHAKSSWDDPDIADHDRPLNARGRRAAALVGQHLSRAGLRFDLVVCSSAIRARQTLEFLDTAATTDVLFEDLLYGAEASALMARLRTIPDSVGSVLVVGHNPGMEALTRLLVDDGSDLVESFPTAALAVLDLPIRTWRTLEPGCAELRGFVIPRSLD